MKYEGNLYGRVGKRYFPLEATSEQFDRQRQLLKESRDLLLLCTLLDKSGQCKELAYKIDETLNDNRIK